ncbi:sulfatase family protein [Cerasicoccus frondis]|uniref:sulfatase family protein n=1 Tax=Cerasicoccus frondis TaxID=490090 RepID=UPI002852CD7F|nr:sulfatase [Cerasicoccus frondis]
MTSSARPNIILINCDDLGYGDLGCYGSTVNRTPALDQMAAEGLRFTDFYMASPVCSPSRGAMMTGCYPPRIGFGEFNGRPVLFPGDDCGLNPDEMTIAKALKQSGYKTKMVGKWHCGDQPEFLPTEHGFDSYFGIPYSNDMGRQFEDDKYPPLPLIRDQEVIQEQPDQAGITERYVEESVRFLRENKDEPFFLYFAHMYVHVPIYAPEKFMRESQNGRYGAGVEMIDWATAAILDELKQLGIDENTLVIFTSDNGSRARGEGGSNGPLRGHKGQTWDGGQRVPCLMRWPKGIPGGQTTSGLATSMDFLPTLAKLCDAKLAEGRMIDGKDISVLLADATADSPNEVFFYYWKNRIEAVRDHEWKLHFCKRDEEGAVVELYNLIEDIGETTNVFDEHPDIVASLMAKVEACREDIGDSELGIIGANCRRIGRVDNPDTLTHYDPSHPYIVAMYDLKQRG